MTNISLSYSTAVLQRSGPTASRSYSAAILQRSGPTAQRSYSVAVLQRSGLSFKIGRKVTKNIRHTQIYLHISPKTRNYCPFRIILRPLLRHQMPAHPLTASRSYSAAVLQHSGLTAQRSYSIAVISRSSIECPSYAHRMLIECSSYASPDVEGTARRNSPEI